MMDNITIEIDESELFEIVKRAVRQQWGRDVDSISLNTHTVSTGYGFAERDEVRFKNITVKMKPRKPPDPYERGF